MTPRAPPAAESTSERCSIQPGMTQIERDVGDRHRDGGDADRPQQPPAVGAVAHGRVQVVEVAQVERAREDQRGEPRPEHRRVTGGPPTPPAWAATGPSEAPASSARTRTVSSAKK